MQYAEDMAEKGGKDARKELDLLTALLVIPSKSQQVMCASVAVRRGAACHCLLVLIDNDE